MPSDHASTAEGWRAGQPARAAIAVAAAVLWGTPATAQDGPAPERVLAVERADWNGDGSPDRAMLLASAEEPDQVDLLVYLSTASGAPRLAVDRKAIAWRGAMAGTEPSLALNERNSLLVRDANESIGRNRWSRTLTLVWRDGGFVVAGYTYASYDTLDPDAAYACDVNLLTGRGVARDKPFRTTAKAIPLADWTDDRVPAQCR